MPHTHGADSGDVSVSVVEAAGTQLEEVESADNDVTTDTDNVPVSLDPNVQLIEADIIDHEVPDQRELISGNSPTGVGENYQLEEGIVTLDALAAEDDVGDGEEVEEEAPFVDIHPTSPVRDVSEGNISPVKSGGTAAVAIAAVELERSEADDILGIDFDEPADLAPINGADEGQDDVEQRVTQNDGIHVGVDDASTTAATPNAEVDILSGRTELNTIDDGADQLVAKDEANQEVESEIDWREYPETLLDDVGGDVSCNTAKRARGEEEEGAEEDQSQSNAANP